MDDFDLIQCEDYYGDELDTSDREGLEED